MKKSTTWLIGVFVTWRIALLAVAAYAIVVIPFKPSFPYWETLLAKNGHPIFWSWANFDGVHYLTIAKSGYSAQYTQAFFPGYPLLIQFLGKILNNEILSGLLISHLALIASLVLFYRLIRLDHGVVSARRTILYLILFPTAFYFVSLYSESIFLALLLAAFYAARLQRWWLAGLFGALASATRAVGILILPCLLVEWYVSRKKKIVYTPLELVMSIFPILLVSSGLIAYMYYLGKAFSDPLLFLHSQPAFGAQRSADKLILLYQVFWRYVKMLFTVEPQSLVYYTVLQEFFSGVIFLTLSLIAFKRVRLSYALFGALAYIVPTLTGTFSSQPRYVLVLFPSFMVLGLVKKRRFQRLWWAASAILLAINTALFIRGYWVA